jgi:hypothetical protein
MARPSIETLESLEAIAETIRRMAPLISAEALQRAWDQREPDSPDRTEAYFRCRDERRGIKA